MAEDDMDGIDTPGPMGWMVRHPFLTSAIIGVLGAFLIGLMLPSHDSGAPEDVTASVVVEKEQPKDAKPVLGAPPAATVPIVAEAAVVITDTGLNRKVAEAIDADMPRDVTLAVSVYATDPAGTAAAFKASGRDVWLQVAAQSTKDGIDPGPLAVAGSLSTKDNMAMFQRQISTTGTGTVVGLYIPEDADITSEDPDMWRDVAMNLIGANMMILDATPAKVATVLYMQKSEAQISAYLKTDVIVSGDMGPAILKKALADAVPLILKDQQAIVVMNRPTVLAVETLSDWVKNLPRKGIRLVPATKFTGLKP
jgi:polysaccharide deacetylase 2 family uncharacterized protein YibQ